MIARLVALTLSQVAPTAGPHFHQVGHWTAISDSGACAIAAEYNSTNTKKLSLIITNNSPDILVVSLASRTWSIVDGAKYNVRITLDDASAELPGTGRRDSSGGKLLLALDPDNLALFAQAQSFEAKIDDVIVARLPLPGSAKAIATLRTCIAQLPSVKARRATDDESDRRIAADPFSAVKPEVVQQPSGPEQWLTNDDYPASALLAEASGTVGYSFQVNEQGRIEGCVIQKSSGNAALDRATCSALTRRGRYSPGRKRVEGSHTWTLPANK